MQETKICCACKQEKSIAEFHKNKSAKFGVQSICKVCRSKQHKKYYIENIEQEKESQKLYYKNHPEKRRIYGLKWRHGISIEQYTEMFNEQKGCCAICGKNQLELKKRLAVDHNHKTNEIRGLLCSNCNIVLGLVNDNIDLLLKTIQFLRRWK